MSDIQYIGRNFTPSSSSTSSFRPVDVDVGERGSRVMFVKRLRGGNGSGFTLDKNDIPELIAQLIGYCGRDSLPSVLDAVSRRLEREG